MRVSEYAVKIGRKLGVRGEKLAELEVASLLHDVGKLGIPDKILKKPGRLTKQEYAIMQGHSSKGAKILENVESLKHLTHYIMHHHERYDGYGYPDGLKGDDIPLIARIIAVADAFDAMTTNRPYRNKKSIEEAIQEIKRCSGTQFDPIIVSAFLLAYEKGNIFTDGNNSFYKKNIEL